MLISFQKIIFWRRTGMGQPGEPHEQGWSCRWIHSHVKDQEWEMSTEHCSVSTNEDTQVESHYQWPTALLRATTLALLLPVLVPVTPENADLHLYVGGIHCLRAPHSNIITNWHQSIQSIPTDTNLYNIHDHYIPVLHEFCIHHTPDSWHDLYEETWNWQRKAKWTNES